MDISKSDIGQIKKYIKTMDDKECLKNLQNDKEEKKPKNKKESAKIKKCITEFLNSLLKYKSIEIKIRFSTRTSRWLLIKLAVLSRNPFAVGRRNNSTRVWEYVSQYKASNSAGINNSSQRLSESKNHASKARNRSRADIMDTTN